MKLKKIETSVVCVKLNSPFSLSFEYVSVNTNMTSRQLLLLILTIPPPPTWAFTLACVENLFGTKNLVKNLNLTCLLPAGICDIKSAMGFFKPWLKYANMELILSNCKVNWDIFAL